MVNYKNSKIYTIRSYQTDKIYIGSTSDELRKRLWAHKNNYKRFKKGLSAYVSSIEIIKYDDAYIELYEKYPCNSKEELHKREGEIIRELECINKRIAGRNGKEWYNDTRDKRLKQMKEYRISNKEKIREGKSKIYNCDCGKMLSTGHKARHEKSNYHRMNVHNILNNL